MKMTKAQTTAITEQLLALDVDYLLHVRIREDPGRDQPRGVLEVLLRDHWSREVVRVDRQGVVSRPSGGPAQQIPGQTAIELPTPVDPERYRASRPNGL